MRKQLHRAIRGAVLALGLAAPVAAQQDMSAEIPSRTPGWSVTPGVTFGAIYDSAICDGTPT